eukprot:722621-Amphidinium_carterae.1
MYVFSSETEALPLPNPKTLGFGRGGGRSSVPKFGFRAGQSSGTPSAIDPTRLKRSGCLHKWLWATPTRGLRRPWMQQSLRADFMNQPSHAEHAHSDSGSV